jgi:hypothetical protein
VVDYNDYYVEWYMRDPLAAARAEVRGHSLIPPRAPIVRPALAAFAAALRKRYVRWSSAASTGSKPRTARA